MGPYCRRVVFLAILAGWAVSASASRVERRFSPWDSDLLPPWSSESAALSGAAVASGEGLSAVLLQPAAWASLRGLELLSGTAWSGLRESGDTIRLSLDGGLSWINFGAARREDRAFRYPEGALGAARGLGKGFRLGGGLYADLLKNGPSRVERAESRLSRDDEIRSWGSHYRLLLGAGLSWSRKGKNLSLGLSWDLAHLGGLGTEIRPYNSTPENFSVIQGGGGGLILGARARWGRLSLGLSSERPGLGRNNFSWSYSKDFYFDQPYPSWTQAGAALRAGPLEFEGDLRFIGVSAFQNRKPPNLYGLYPSQPFPLAYRNARGFSLGLRAPFPSWNPRPGVWPSVLRLGFSREPSWYAFNTAEIPELTTQSGLIPERKGRSLSLGLSGGRRFSWNLSLVRSTGDFLHHSVERLILLDLGFRTS